MSNNLFIIFSLIINLCFSGEEEEAKYIAKRKMLGNIKFIGELGKLEMLHDSTIHKCCEHVSIHGFYKVRK